MLLPNPLSRLFRERQIESTRKRHLSKRALKLEPLEPRVVLSATTLFTFNGDSAGDFLGASVSGAGDVNGDGFDEVIVGAFGDDNNGSSSGSARVFSGQDGSVLFTSNGDSAVDRFGWSVRGAGDVNGDAFDDLIVRAFQDDNNGSSSGSARVISIETPVMLIGKLIVDVVALDLQQGLENSLVAKLDNAIQKLEDSNPNNDVVATNKLNDFINQVNAQRGNGIPEPDADQLITDA